MNKYTNNTKAKSSYEIQKVYNNVKKILDIILNINK